MKKIRSIVNVRTGNPIIPRRADDPAAQFSNLRNGNAQLKKRYDSIKKGLRELISSFSPVIVTNVSVYEYQLDAQKYNSINLYLQQLLYGELLEDQQGAFSNRWWLNGNITTAYTDGTSDALQSAKNIAVAEIVGQQISSTVRSTQLENIVFSQGFSSRIGLVQARVFEEMKGLTDSSKTDLANTLARGMASGKGVKALSKEVMERTDVSLRRAKRIVRTEVLNSYRTATSAETDVINDDVYGDSEWGMLQLWWSALAATSRPNHVSKHGEVYTTAEVRAFYAINGNAIHCLCSQSPVLANKKTGEILQTALQKRMRDKKEVYQKARGLITKPVEKVKETPKKVTKPKKQAYTKIPTIDARNELSNRFSNADFKSTVPDKMESLVLNNVNELSRQYKIQGGDDQVKKINISSTMYRNKRFGKGVGGVVATGGNGDKTYSLNSKYFKNEKALTDYYSGGFSAQVDEANLSKYIITHEFGHMIYIPKRSMQTKRDNLSDAFDDFFNGESYRSHLKTKSKYFAEVRQLKAKSRQEIEAKYRSGEISIDDANAQLQAASAKVSIDFRENNKDYFVSEYAMTNQAELIAEAFAEYKLNSNPSKISLEIGAIIDKHAKR